MKAIISKEQTVKVNTKYNFKQLDNKLYIIDNGEIVSIIIEIGDLAQAISLAKCMIRAGFIYPMVSIDELKRLVKDYVKSTFTYRERNDKVAQKEKKVERNQKINIQLFYATDLIKLIKLSGRSTNQNTVSKNESALKFIGRDLYNHPP